MDARTTSRCRCASPHRNNYSTAWQGISTSISNVVPHHVIRIFDVTSSGYLTSHLKNYTTPHCENYTSLQGKIAHLAEIIRYRSPRIVQQHIARIMGLLFVNLEIS